MKIRLFKYFLCNSKMYFMSICILTCEIFCFHRSSFSSFHHNTHTFQPFLMLYKFLFFLFHFLIINIDLSLCYLVVTSWLTRRFVTSRQKVPFFKMAFSRVQVGTTHLSQYRIQLTVGEPPPPPECSDLYVRPYVELIPRSYIQVSRLVGFLSSGSDSSYGSHHLLWRTTTTRCSDPEVEAAHAHSLLERDEMVEKCTVQINEFLDSK